MSLTKKSTLIIVAIMFTFVFGTGYVFAEVGVTDSEIKIGGILDLSGPIAFMGKSVSDGSNSRRYAGTQPIVPTASIRSTAAHLGRNRPASRNRSGANASCPVRRPKRGFRTPSTRLSMKLT